MGDFEEDIRYIRDFMSDVEMLSRKCREPLDTRVEPLLAIIYSLAREQIKLKKRYEWGSRPQQEDEFVDDTDIPSIDDLRKMMGDNDDES